MIDYQEKFKITDENSHYFSQQFDFIITGERVHDNIRHNYLLNALSTFRGKIISLDTCENAMKFFFTIEDFDGTILEKSNEKSLIPDLENFIRKAHLGGSRICIDITSLKQGVLFLLTNIFIKKIKPAVFCAAYTEPLDYNKREIIGIGDNEEYDLYDKLIGSSNPVPGFSKSQSLRDILLLAPIGFDTQRLQTIYENLKPKKIRPIVGFPSFVPGWKLTAIKMNYYVLKSADCLDEVISCEASSPFAMYALLDEEFQRHNRYFDIYISPLGTRPHCLGAAIFASRNSSVFLIYDFPVEKKYRSQDVLKTNIYNLSKYLD